MSATKIYPVIHYLNRGVALSQVKLAQDCGASGVFLISHRNDDVELAQVAGEAKQSFPDFCIGLNLLTRMPETAVACAMTANLDMVWADDMGVSSRGLTKTGAKIAELACRHPQLKLFASVAFKYQATEPMPALAATNALAAGFIPTTSGNATGHAPDVAKISAMFAATQGILAIASGMTPENVAQYAPYLSHILVATGIAQDEYRINPAKLELLLANAQAA